MKFVTKLEHRLTLALLVLAFILRADGHAASTSWVQDVKPCTGTAASGGGTFTCDYTTTTDRASYLDAEIGLSDVNSSHLHDAALMRAEYVVENKNGTVTAASPYTSSNNPANSNTTTFVAAHAQGSDSAFAGGGPPTCVWSISGTHARLTVTNSGATTADVTVLIHVFNFGSQ